MSSESSYTLNYSSSCEDCSGEKSCSDSSPLGSIREGVAAQSCLRTRPGIATGATVETCRRRPDSQASFQCCLGRRPSSWVPTSADAMAIVDLPLSGPRYKTV